MSMNIHLNQKCLSIWDEIYCCIYIYIDLITGVCVDMVLDVIYAKAGTAPRFMMIYVVKTLVLWSDIFILLHALRNGSSFQKPFLLEEDCQLVIVVFFYEPGWCSKLWCYNTCQMAFPSLPKTQRIRGGFVHRYMPWFDQNSTDPQKSIIYPIVFWLVVWNIYCFSRYIE